MDVNVKLEDVKAVESNSIDLSKYNNEKVAIEKAEVVQVPSGFTEKDENGNHYLQWVLKVQSVPLASIGEGDELIEFRASELFNLVQEKAVLRGFPTGEQSNLRCFIDDLGIKDAVKMNLSELVEQIKGKMVIVKSFEREKDGKKRTYLKFKY